MLLEAVLALALLLVMVGLVSGAMYRTTTALERMRAQATAEDLAVSVLSEMRAGIRAAAAGGPEPFDEPWTQWTWQVERETVDADPGQTRRLEMVTIRIEHLDLPIEHALRRWEWEQTQEAMP